MSVNIVMYNSVLLNGINLRLKRRKSKSDLLKIVFSIGSLTKAINNVAAALTPPESEKKSTERPSKKLPIRSKVLFFLKGNRNTHTM